MKFTGKLTKEQPHNVNNREKKPEVHKLRETNHCFVRYVRKKGNRANIGDNAHVHSGKRKPK